MCVCGSSFVLSLMKVLVLIRQSSSNGQQRKYLDVAKIMARVAAASIVD